MTAIKYQTTVTDVSYEKAFSVAIERANFVLGEDNWCLKSANLADILEVTSSIYTPNRVLLECDFTFVRMNG